MITTSSSSPRSYQALKGEVNNLLASLSASEAQRVLPELELVPLESRKVLFEQGQPMGHVYFPITGMISLLRKMHDRTAVEIGAVGCEGMVGLPVFLGVGTSDTLCRVQVTGEAWRISSEAFLKLAHANIGLSAAVGVYTAASLAAALQLAACNLLHLLSQRCARSLLTIHDHVTENELFLTHEQLAQMLGVRRAGVTAAVGVFQARKIITSRRGVITILDRQRLEEEACECGAAIRALYGQLK
jgi:CRP-like cAMP-binding protein